MPKSMTESLAAVTGASRVVRERESLRAVIESIGRETDLRPLLTHVLRHACALVAADDGVIGLVDQARGVVVSEAAYHMPPEELGSEMPIGAGLAGQVLKARAPVRVRRYGDLPYITQPHYREHAVLGLPISLGGSIIGFMGLGRAPRKRADGRPGVARGFSLRDQGVLETFARHAAIAIENARRFARERRRTERSALIAQVGQLVSADLRLDELLQRAADAIHGVLGYENVAIPLIDPEDPGTMTLRAFGGAYKHQIGGEHRLAITVGLMGAAARAGVVVLVNDVTSDPRYLITPGSAGTGAELAVPILLGSRVLGVVNVERALPFAQDDADALRVVADQLAVAIENARLHEEAQRAAALEERHRLARELHDSVTQLLFSATLVAQSIGSAYARDPAEGATRAAQLLELNRSALAEMRALLSELRPLPRASGTMPRVPDAPDVESVAQVGLSGALRSHVAQVAPLTLRVSVHDDEWEPQLPVCEEALYRIAREALHNVVKHAQATQVDIKLSVRDRLVRLLVLDDGIGIATAKEGRRGSHLAGGLGLETMRERATAIGGVLRITKAPAGGTSVEVSLPAQPATA